MSRHTLATAAFVGAAAAIGSSAFAVTAANKPTLPGSSNPAGNWVDQRVGFALTLNTIDPVFAGHGPVTGDASTLTFTGTPSVPNNFSTPGTWSAVPAAGDSFSVTAAPGANPSADIIVNNDQGLAFGSFVVTRPTATDNTTLTGGYNGTAIQSIRGNTVVNGGTVNLSLVGAGSTANTGIVAGASAGQTASLTFQGGAVVSYNSVRVGLGGSNGNLLITGAGTTLNQVYDPTQLLATQQAVFGSSGAANNANITIENGGTVNTLNAFHSLRGVFSVNAGGTLNVNSVTATGSEGARAISGLINMAQSVGSTITTNVNGGVVNLTGFTGAAFDSNANFAKFAQFDFGTAANAVTSLNITNGGKVNLTDSITLLGGVLNGTGGTAPVLPTTLDTNNTTINVDGAGSAITASASSRVEFGGSSSFINYAYGTTNVNVTGGGQIVGNFVTFSAGDRSATLANGSPAAAQVTNLTVASGGSLVVGTSTATGFLNLSIGDNTTTNVNINSGGSITSGVLRSGSNGGVTTVNVNSGGTMTLLALQPGRNAFGQAISNSTTTVNVNGTGQLNSQFVELGQIATNSTDTLNVLGGGTLTSQELDTSNSPTEVANLNVSGAGSKATFTGTSFLGGDNTDVSSGTTNVNVSAGGTLTFGQLSVGGPDAVDVAPAAAGSNITVDGTGSSVNVVGRPDTTPPGTAIVDFNGGINSRSSVTVKNGGAFNVLQTVGTPDLSGLVVLASAEGAVGSITVDGVGSVFNGGRALLVAQADSASTSFGNATALINVINGGKLTTVNGVQLGIGPVTSSTITLNIGGGTGAGDASSLLQAGGLVVGGTNDTTTGAAIVGAPATVNLFNGKIDVSDTRVYTGSNLNITKGELNSALIAARGGHITINPTTAIGAARLVADLFAADNNGVIDIAKNGGISFIQGTDTAATEVANIKALIVAGVSGGANSIKSSAVTSTVGPSAIGYALRLPGATAKASFLGYTFDTNDSAVIFRTTLKGDTDLTGTVDFDDLVTVAQNYNKSGQEWYQGDFNYDGNVNFDDLVPLAQNYNGTYSLGELTTLGGSGFAQDWILAQSLAPEPASLGVLIAAAGLLGRRRR